MAEEKISIIVPVYNGSGTLNQCLQAISSSEYTNYEVIVVDDGSTDSSREVVQEWAAGDARIRLVALEGAPKGPAFARNCGSEGATGRFLFFVDADVIIKPDTLGKITETFDRQPGLSALFGSYDESPAGAQFLSQYKNLLHHFVHQRGQEEAATFWSGCGAVRRDVFASVGGFDAKRYPKPSIEDIELGARLLAGGHKILLNKEIQVKHLKNWSLTSLIKTDIWYRAIPWTQLILQNREMPNDLNLHVSQRLSSVLLLVMLLHVGLYAFKNDVILLPLLVGLFLLLVNNWQWSEGKPSFAMSTRGERLTFGLMGAISILALFSNEAQLLAPMVLLLPILLVGRALGTVKSRLRTVLFAAMMLAMAVEFVLLFTIYPTTLVIPLLVLLILIMLLNHQLYMFFARKRGLVFALAVLPLQLLYYLYSGIAFVIGGGIHFWKSGLKSKL